MKKVPFQVFSLLVLGSIILAACAPATSAAPVETQPPATAAPAVPTDTQAAALPSCGTDPVVMNAYFETGFTLPFSLTVEFTNQFPNVTWDIKQDQFTNLINETPRLLTSDNPPDLIRLPTFVTFAEDGLLYNLDDYATAFGWNDWPVPLNFARVSADGIRGSGSLYAMGLNYQLTGVFYKKHWRPRSA